MMSLRKHIKSHHRFEGVAAGEQFLEIAGERGRVTGDVGNVTRMQVENSLDDDVLCAGSWRIEQQKIDGRN